jgi:hypothetical protein
MTMKTMKIGHVAVQCVASTGERGSFPVFAEGLTRLYPWLKANWTQAPYDPAHPCGTYYGLCSS